VRQLRFLTAMVGMAATGAVAWSVTVGVVAASASTRLRSGNLHAQLVSHVAPAGNTSSSQLLADSDVIAGIVASLAVLALAFVIVTLIRRRITPPSPRPIA
jgi:hypothetical protein